MKPSVNPDVLIATRESRNESQTNTADAAGISQGMISKAENGIIDLDAGQVEAIAQFLHYPTELFYEPGRVRTVGSACLYHRKRKTLPAKVLTSLNARMELRRVAVRRLLREVGFDPERLFHTLDLDEYNNSPAEVAQALRAAWRIPSGPIANMTEVIESAAGIVLMADFGTNKLMGMSCWERGSQPLFYLNSRMSTADLRWTLAHELGHVVMHAVPPTGDPEEQADAFAGEFLAPAALIVPALRRLTFDQLYPLKMTWRLSIKAIITRAKKLGAIDKELSVRLYKQFSARGFNTVEPYPLTPELPTLIAGAVAIHLGEHEYSPQQLAEEVAYLYEDEFVAELADLPRAARPKGRVIQFPASSIHLA